MVRDLKDTAAGCLLGGALGLSAVPAERLRDLELRDEIADVVAAPRDPRPDDAAWPRRWAH